MATLLGRPRDSLIGQPALELLSNDDRPRLAAEMDARRHDHDGGAELTIQRPDGSTRRCLVHGSPLYDGREQLIGSVSVWTDITRRHQAEEALRVSEFVINASAELISVIDELEVYRNVNDAWCRAFGRERHRVVGRHRDEVMPGLVSPQRAQALQRCLATRQALQVRDVVQLPGQPAAACTPTTTR